MWDSKLKKAASAEYNDVIAELYFKNIMGRCLRGRWGSGHDVELRIVLIALYAYKVMRPDSTCGMQRMIAAIWWQRHCLMWIRVFNTLR